MAPPSNHRIVLAHGFTQTARSWDAVVELFEDRLPGVDIVAIDMPGHGTAADIDADLWRSAARLTEIGGPATYIGYSMGGRVALHAALTHSPDRSSTRPPPHSPTQPPGHSPTQPPDVQRLVLIGATGGIDDTAERAERRRADDHVADRIEAIGVEAFIEEWLSTPLFARLTPANNQRDDRMRNTAAGLASSLRSTGTGTQAPLWDRLGEIEVPVLVVVGEEDTKFRALGERLGSKIPRSEVAVIASAGHSVHLEAPAETVDVIVRWLRDQDVTAPA